MVQIISLSGGIFLKYTTPASTVFVYPIIIRSERRHANLAPAGKQFTAPLTQFGDIFETPLAIVGRLNAWDALVREPSAAAESQVELFQCTSSSQRTAIVSTGIPCALLFISNNDRSSQCWLPRVLMRRPKPSAE